LPFIGRNTRKYCSEKCRMQHRLKVYAEKLNEHTNCEYCSNWIPAWVLTRSALIQRKHCSEKCRDRIYCIRKMGITVEHFWQMWGEQQGLCQLCFCVLEDTTRDKVKIGNWVAIDHDHCNGKVRGLLHRRCNRDLGLIEHRLVFTKNCLIYLEKHSEAK
jgi:hypothetical protein